MTAVILLDVILGYGAIPILRAIFSQPFSRPLVRPGPAADISRW